MNTVLPVLVLLARPLGPELEPQPLASSVVSATLLPPLAPLAIRIHRPGRPIPPRLPGALGATESMRFRVGFGPIGGLAEVRMGIEDEHSEDGHRLVRVTGSGEGSFLGLGRFLRRIESDFDAGTLAPRRWTLIRHNDEDRVTTRGDQPRPGEIAIERREDGREPEHAGVTLQEAAFDPMGLLVRLRVRPPADGEVQALRVFDGSRLWIVTVRGAGRRALPGTDGRRQALRLDGRAEPVFYGGEPDLHGDRPTRDFVLWLSDDVWRTPLRLSVPIGPSEVTAELVEYGRTLRPTR